MLTIQILIALALGLVCGKLYPTAPLWESVDTITLVALYALLFFIGIDLGRNRGSGNRSEPMVGGYFCLVPLQAHWQEGALAGWLLAMPVREALVASAAWWYSLAGVMISQMGHVELGALAFLVNLLRELLAFVLIPLVASHLGNIPAIAPGSHDHGYYYH